MPSGISVSNHSVSSHVLIFDRSGITITASYAIRQSSRLLKTVEGSEKEELQDLQQRLDSKIRVRQQCITLSPPVNGCVVNQHLSIM